MQCLFMKLKPVVYSVTSLDAEHAKASIWLRMRDILDRLQQLVTWML